MKKTLKNILLSILVVLFVISLCPMILLTNAETATYNKTDFGLKFGADGKFKIMQFADIQNHYPIKDKEMSVIKRAISYYQPDLIVLSGDNLYQPETEEKFREVMGQYVACFEGIPFAVTFGNHDSEDDLTRQRQYDLYKEYGAVDFDNNFSQIDLGGVGTGNVPIRSSDGNSVAYNVVLFDSGTYDDAGGYGKVGYSDKSPYNDEEAHNGVVSWFRSMNEAMKDYSANGDYVPTIAFQHIPMKELYTSGILASVSSSTEGAQKGNSSAGFGGNYYIANPDNPTVTGELNEAPSVSTSDTSAQYIALAEKGNVKAIFYGHDHLNDIMGEGTVNYNGVDYTLVQGHTKSTTASDYSDGTQHFRIFELDEATGEFTTESKAVGDVPGVFAPTPELVDDPDSIYEAYNVIEYENLNADNCMLLLDKTEVRSGAGATILTYDCTSPTHSAILKFNWTTASTPKLQISFDKVSDDSMDYMFGAWLSAPGEESGYPNGRMWIIPGKGQQVDLSKKLAGGSTHTVEFARLKIKSGEDKGKYYIYIKIDDVLIAQGYVAANVVDEEGNYTSEPGSTALTLSNEIFMASWGATGGTISKYDPSLISPDTSDPDDSNPDDSNPDNPDTGEETFAPHDVVTLAELGFASDRLSSEDHKFSYNSTSSTNSVVLKFEFEANIADGDDKGWQIILDGKWNDNYILWFRSDHTYLHTIETGYVSSPAVTSGKHELEFGRLRVATGVNAGKDYLYYKIDGELVLEMYVTPNSADAGKVLFRGDMLCDQVFVIPEQVEEYEAYDEVSLATLGVTSNVIAHNVDWNVDKESFDNAKFNYEGTSDTYSIKLTFEWEAAQSASEVNWQLILDGKWNTSCLIYFTPDQIAIYNAAGEVTSISDITSGKHSVEVARLRVKTGAAAGKDHLYLKVDGVVLFERFQKVSDVNQYTVTFRGDCIEAQRFADHFYNEGSVLEESTACNVAGQKKYTCDVCGHEKTEDYYLEHTYGELIAEVPASCTDDGCAAHYECSVCEKLFDADKKEKTAQELVIAAHGHDLTHNLATDATCCAQGTVEHYSCSICEKNFNASLEEIEIHTAIDSNAHEWGEWVVTKEATTSEEGVETRTCANDPTHVEERPIDKLPKKSTGCSSSVDLGLSIVLVLITVAVGYSIVSRKKRNN